MNKPDDHVMVRQIECYRLARRFQRVGVIGEQHQRRESRRTDRVTFGHGLGGVADRIQRIGDRAHRIRQSRHLGDAARVVGDRTVGVERDDDAGHRQHRGGGDRDAVETGERVGAVDRSAHRNDGPRGRFHRHAEAGDDVGAMTGGRSGSDVAHRRVFGRGVILGDHHHQRGKDQTDDRCAKQLHGREFRIIGADVFPSASA